MSLIPGLVEVVLKKWQMLDSLSEAQSREM